MRLVEIGLKGMKRQSQVSRDEQANVAARAIIEAERQKHEAKTTRLREARLAKEASEALAPAQRKNEGGKAKEKR
jgi:hypothetical protein